MVSHFVPFYVIRAGESEWTEDSENGEVYKRREGTGEQQDG